MEEIDKIKCVLIDFEQNDKTLDEAANEILRSLRGSLDLDSLEKRLDEILNKETSESLKEWLYKKRQLNKLKKEIEPFKNTLIIDDFDTVVRLVDVIDDDDDDYWVYDSRKGIYHSSCGGGWIPLKGFLEQGKYNEMVRRWSLNNIEKAV